MHLWSIIVRLELNFKIKEKHDCEVENISRLKYESMVETVFRFTFVTVSEVKKIINSLYNKKSSGIDEMSNIFVKKISNEIAKTTHLSY